MCIHPTPADYHCCCTHFSSVFVKVVNCISKFQIWSFRALLHRELLSEQRTSGKIKPKRCRNKMCTQLLLIITAAAHISRLYLSKWWIVFPNSKSDHLGHFYTESSSQSKEQVEKLNPKDAGIKQWHNFAPPSWIWQDEVYFQVSWGTWLIYTSPHPVIQSQSSSLILTVLSSLEFVGVSKICAQIFAHFSILTKLPKICALFLQSFQIWQNCPKSVLNFDTLFITHTTIATHSSSLTLKIFKLFV